MQTPAFLVHLATRVFSTLFQRDTRPTLYTSPCSASEKLMTPSPTKDATLVSTLPVLQNVAPSLPSHKPLRIVHLPEATGIGRMRISGRMADVCAELDRLAALEAA